MTCKGIISTLLKGSTFFQIVFHQKYRQDKVVLILQILG